jgi:hypothetical protein
VLGPDGKPLDGVFVAGLTDAYSPVHGSPAKVKLATAAFTAIALNSRAPRTLVFWHEKKKLGRAVLVRGTESGLLSVRLEPHATATGRLIDATGRHQAGRKVQARYSSRQSQTLPGEISPSVQGLVPAVLPLPEATTDRDGRFRLQGLMAGMKYDLVVTDGDSASTLMAEVSVPPGDSKDLGDLKVPPKTKKPAKEKSDE